MDDAMNNSAGLLGDEIPVLDASGKKMVLKGSGMINLTPTGRSVPEPPANLPFAEDHPAAAPAKLTPAQQAAAAVPSLAAVIPPEPPRPLSSKAVPVTPADLGLDATADKKDIAKIAEQPVVQQMTAEKKRELPLLERSVEDALTANGGTLRDDDMRRRFRTLISLYFRGLRDELETTSKLTMPVTSGGMGFDDVAAGTAMSDIRARSRSYHGALAAQASDDKADYVAGRTEKLLNLQESAARADKEKGDEAYQGLLNRVGMRAEADAVMPPKPPAPPKIIPVVGEAGATVPTAPAPVQVLASPAASHAAAAMPRPSASRPVVADVAYSPRLTGPVDELRSLTLKDFRRLSKIPSEAALKIRDKIDLLEEQSFVLKTAGIRGWQESELNRMYLEILRESLNGLPVAQVIAEKENSGAPVVSQAEFEAIMDLNAKLRFG